MMFIPVWFIVLVAIVAFVGVIFNTFKTESLRIEQDHQREEQDAISKTSPDLVRVWLSDLYRSASIEMYGDEYRRLCSEIVAMRERYSFFEDVEFTSRSGIKARAKGRQHA